MFLTNSLSAIVPTMASSLRPQTGEKTALTMRLANLRPGFALGEGAVLDKVKCPVPTALVHYAIPLFQLPLRIGDCYVVFDSASELPAFDPNHFHLALQGKESAASAIPMPYRYFQDGLKLIARRICLTRCAEEPPAA